MINLYGNQKSKSKYLVDQQLLVQKKAMYLPVKKLIKKILDDLILKKEKLAKLQQEKSDSEKKRMEMIRVLQKDKESNQLKLVREQGAKE